MITIAIVNESTVLGDRDVVASASGGGVLDALRRQVTRDFCPAWGIDIPTLRYFPKNAGPAVIPSDAWVLALLDDSDQADALGYHDDSANGTPQGKVFVKTCLDDKESWSVCLSHELLEMLADPNINRCAEGADGRIYAVEVCDPVEDDSLGYEIGAVLVSDFVLPAWYAPATPRATAVDFRGRVHQGFELGVGGYAMVLAPDAGGNWTQINADDRARRKRPMQRGSRRERRLRQHRERARAFAAFAMAAGLRREE